MSAHYGNAVFHFKALYQHAIIPPSRFLMKISVLFWPPLHTTSKTEMPSWSFLTQDATADGGRTTHSSHLTVWWMLNGDSVSLLVVHNCLSSFAMDSHLAVPGISEVMNPWQAARCTFSVSQRGQPQVGAVTAPSAEPQGRRPLNRTQDLQNSWTALEKYTHPRGHPTHTVLGRGAVFLHREQIFRDVSCPGSHIPTQKRPTTLSRHCLVSGYKPSCFRTWATL